LAKGVDYISIGITKWLQKEFLQKKLLSLFGIGLLVLLAVLFGLLAATNFYLVNFGFGIVLIIIIIVYYCIFKPLIGFYIMTFISFFIFYPSHLIGQDIPLSPGLEALVVFLFLGIFLSAKNNAEKKGNLLKTPVSGGIALLLIFSIIEAFNPNIAGMGLSGWGSFLKRYVFCIFIYVITYRLIDTPNKLRFYLKFWIILSFIAALYGCFQQWFGYLPSELAYIKQQPFEFALMNQGGMLRKFSFFSDVVSFGILSGSMAVLTLLLAINEKGKKRKYVLLFFAMIMTVGMAYSGTRTTTILIPAGFIMYGFLTIQNKKTIIALFVFVLTGLAILFAPIYTPTILRIRSTFDSKNASLDVRNVNRHYIQPYIYAHPIGGGINTTGIEGEKYYPAHRLAGFPPDSGLLKSALETGGIGYALIIFFNLLILYQGIYYHFRMRNNEYRKYIAVLISTLFPIIVAQYSQSVMGQIPDTIFFFGVLSLMKRLMEFDKEKKSSKMANNLANELSN
jgi:putative inorganic carbon (HCO3(-)) transporter